MAQLKMIKHYEVRSKLGRGGMANVILAYDTNLEREVAIKLLDPYFSRDPQFAARFEREAKTITSLEHSHIVPVYDYGEYKGLPYLVMRYMRGGTLTRHLKNGPLSIGKASRIIERIANALDHAHAHGIIHRDLKPDNILFDGSNLAFLSDFGIVKIAESSTTYTQTGNTLGTPAYMSPEQAKAVKEIDGRSDIYSLGVILYEVLTGDIPYKADSSLGQAMMHVLEPIPRIIEANPDLPDEVEAIIQKAMAKEPDNRHDTATELSDELMAAAQGRFTMPVMPGVVEPKPTPVQPVQPQLGKVAVSTPEPTQPSIEEKTPENLAPSKSIPAPVPLEREETATSSTVSPSEEPKVKETVTPPASNLLSSVESRPVQSTPQPAISPKPVVRQRSEFDQPVSGGKKERESLEKQQEPKRKNSPLVWVVGLLLILVGAGIFYVVTRPKVEFTSNPVSTVDVGDEYIYNITTSDTNAKISAGSLPGWLSLTGYNNGTAVLRGFPDNNVAGDHRVSIQLSDESGVLNKQSFTITVIGMAEPPGESPIFTSDPTLDAEVGSEYFYEITTSDSNALITVAELPYWLDFSNNGDGTAFLNGIPGGDDTGQWVFSVDATNDYGSTSQQILLEVFANEVSLRAGEEWIRPTDGMVMVYVPRGTFSMGINDAFVEQAFSLCLRGDCQRSRFENQYPPHEVTVDDFWIDQTDVTNAQFAIFLSQNGNQVEGGVPWFNIQDEDAEINQQSNGFVPTAGFENHPVVEVTWYGANTYCSWAGGQLPTEAQWEYAARGDTGWLYPWGNEFDGSKASYCDSNCPTDWADDNANDGYDLLAPVGQYRDGASWVGALDMAGNVWNWVADWYDADYYEISPDNNPGGPANGSSRVVRGGSFVSDSVDLWTTFRWYDLPEATHLTFGFRCAVQDKW